ncbi:MAG: 4-hydroxy-tetrahydrodipicolinate reductase [Christensenellales bacterium]
MKRLMISGACGRMGRMVAAEAEAAGFQPVAGIDPSAGSCPGFPVFASFADCDVPADVLIDFSSPRALPQLLRFAQDRHLPCVLGATAYLPEDLLAIGEAAVSLPIFQSSNMSLGVHVLRQLAMQARQLLPGFDIEILEKHHKGKLDAPSGTALTLYAAIKGEDSLPVFGRHGPDALRQEREIGLHAVRGGTQAGEHELGFYGRHEHLLLTHVAESRAVFAAGALAAAGWLIGRAPGLYGMENLMSANKPAE